MVVDEPIDFILPYQAIIGNLQFASVDTQPNIFYASECCYKV